MSGDDKPARKRLTGGIYCPVCGARTRVTETRETEIGLRRRRRCPSGHRSTTHELAIASHAPNLRGPLVVVPAARLDELREWLEKVHPAKRDAQDEGQAP